MKYKKTIVVTLSGLVIMLVFSFARPVDKYFYIAKSLYTFSTLFKELNRYYVDPIDPKTLTENGMKGMLESLDPYGSYIATEDARAFDTQTMGQYAGIGVLIGKINDKTVILDVYKKFPAAKVGLKIGDEIISIDGTNIQGNKVRDVSKRLQGKFNTEVKLLIRRPGEANNTLFSIMRKKVKLHDIAYQGIIQENIGYIKLEDFRAASGVEMEKAVTALKAKGATRLILDLRDNLGGLLYEAINVVNVFIPKGKEIVSVKGRAEKWNKSYTSLNDPIDVNLPIAVLVNGNSASAAEIVAGALQDYDRALLLGQTTFGKGLVQTTRALPYDAQLKITTAKYYIPSGRCIQAINYTQKKEAKEEAPADTLEQEYLTRAGRKVYEGKGITPDIKTENVYFAPLTSQLVVSGQLFDYATLFCATHTPPSSPKEFDFSEMDYWTFVEWLKKQNFDFSSSLDEQVKRVIDIAKKEKVYVASRDQWLALEEAARQNQQAGVVKFKDEIIRKLREEILLHYGLVDNPIEMTLGSDQEILAATKILNDSIEYKRILSLNSSPNP